MTYNKQALSSLPHSLTNSLRVIWVIVFITLAGIFIGGIAPRFEELSTICRAELCPVLTLPEAEASALTSLGLSMANYAAYHLAIEILTGGACVLLAGLMFWRRFDEPLGILLSFMLLLFGLNFLVETDTAFYRLYPDFLIVQNMLSAFTTLPFVLSIYVFPDGRFVPRWGRYFVLLVSILALLDPFVLRQAFSVSSSGELSILLTFAILISVLVGVGSQIYRFRFVSNPAQKQQTKWVLIGFLSLLVPLVGWTFLFEVEIVPDGLPRLIANTLVYGVMAMFLFFFPLSFVIAITRYRLWDIDLLIRRTLVYSILTGALILVYFGSVVVVQTAVNTLTGEQQTSQLTIALSTLLIAALFTPLRRRLQDFIDLRFYRRKYDAARTLVLFAQVARDEVNMDNLSARLVQVVEETMQPKEVSLWLKSDRT